MKSYLQDQLSQTDPSGNQSYALPYPLDEVVHLSLVVRAIRKGGRSKRFLTFFNKEISFSAIASGHSIAHKARTVFHNHANLAKILHQKELGFDFLVKEYLRHGVHGCDCGGRSLGGGNDLNKFHQVCRREKVCAYNILLPFCN